MSVKSATAFGLSSGLEPGLVLLNTQTVSGASAYNATNVLSSAYNFYRVQFAWAGSAVSWVNMRFRENTTDKATGYYGSKVVSQYTGGSVGIDGAVNNGTNMLLVDHYTGAALSYVSFDLTISNGGTNAAILGIGWDDTNGRTCLISYKNGSMTNCTGFSFISNSGTITGTVSIYGYNK